MPVHKRMPSEVGAHRDELVADLIGELRHPKPIGQPIVLEDDTPQTNSVRVYVIWDRWSECARDARSDIIVDAYKTAYYKEFADRITLALGLTVPEGVAMGLLPIKVAPARRKDGDPSEEEYQRTMIAAGASDLSGSEVVHSWQVRCPTMEDAEKAIEYLEKVLPHSRWIVVREVTVL